MGLSSIFSFGTTLSAANAELPSIYPMSIVQSEFVKIDVVNVYAKILTDVLERTSGLSEDQQTLLFDSCVKSENSDGLITMLSKAMADKKELFLIYDKAINAVSVANVEETAIIKEDYLKVGYSESGVYISFKNYTRSDMIKFYSALEYCTIDSLNKQVNLSAAIQFKMDNLRQSVGLTDKADVAAQAQSISEALGRGNNVLLDGKDIIETSAPDMTATEKAVEFLNQKRSFYLGLPYSYISGEQTGGIGSTGEADTRAVERGLKNYYFSIIKPVIYSLFDVKTKYKSQDFRMVTQGLAALQTFTLAEDDLISQENKKKIIDVLFDLESTGE